MSTTRPHTLADVMDILDIGERQAQRLAHEGRLGGTRLPTAAERRRWNLAPNAVIVRSMSLTQRLAKIRQKALADQRIRAATKRRKGR